LTIQPTGYFWVSTKVLTPYGYSNPYHIGDPITFEFQVTNKGSNTIKHWEMVVKLYNDETGEYLMTYRNERYENIEHGGGKKTVYCGTYTPQTDDDLYFNWEFAAWRPDGVREVCTSGSHYWLRIIPQEDNTPPVARFTYTPANPKVNQPVSLDASNSYDPDGSITRYYWDTNGDGTYDISSSSPSATVYYLKTGTYTITLKVKDNDGAIDTTSKTITVEKEEQNKKPVPIFTYTPQNPQVGETIYFDASDSYDPDGSITDYYWDWDGDGGFEGYGKTPTHTFTEPGTYGVTLLVYDNENEGNWTRQYITVEGEEQPPTITISISTWVVIATTTASIGLLIAISRWLL